MLLEPLRGPIAAVYTAVLSIVCVYGLHRLVLLLTWVVVRHRRPIAAAQFAESDLPRVTVQLPMFNEPFVAERVIRAACAIDYPPERLQIQVLDDSTDSTTDVVRRTCDTLRESGHDIVLIHRHDRAGFKAGALANGLRSATGELIAVFDADFVPPRDFLRRTVDYFTDEDVAVVQARWQHLNADDSALTRAQAMILDGHFLIEQPTRNRSGRFSSFNGTAGVWRRAAIGDAGGWRGDTLTEDMDLSYRAQLRGWKFVYLDNLTCPAELPPRIDAFKSQQHRWTKGAIQNGRKHLATILTRGDLPLTVKSEAWFHMTHPLIYPVIVVLSLLLLPVLRLDISAFDGAPLSGALLSAALFVGATLSVMLYYGFGQRAAGSNSWRAIARLPMAMSLGIGLSVSNTVGVIAALMGHRSAFVRTPKYEAVGQDPAWHDRIVILPPISRSMLITAGELGMAAYMLITLAMIASTPSGLWSMPFLLLFAFGYGYVGIAGLLATRRPRRDRPPCPVAEMP